MSVFEIKSTIHQLVEKLEDEAVLLKIEKILEEYLAVESVVWDELPVELQNRLDKSEEDAKSGNVIPHDEVVSRFRKQYAHFYES
ncbi:hypothetical protein [Emticicia sp. W12TSBA100-4]|uniref:hypothetical protein n=1 Tax=Emticicia sp. W12TSBA100-4 TaxID=3160965 RepID=UPI003305E411